MALGIQAAVFRANGRVGIQGHLMYAFVPCCRWGWWKWIRLRPHAFLDRPHSAVAGAFGGDKNGPRTLVRPHWRGTGTRYRGSSYRGAHVAAVAQAPHSWQSKANLMLVRIHNTRVGMSTA